MSAFKQKVQEIAERTPSAGGDDWLISPESFAELISEIDWDMEPFEVSVDRQGETTRLRIAY